MFCFVAEIAEICFKVLAVSSCGFPFGSLVPEYISSGLCYTQLSLCAETLLTAPRFILFSPHLHGLTGYIYFLPLGLFIYLVSRVRECQVGARQYDKPLLLPDTAHDGEGVCTPGLCAHVCEARGLVGHVRRLGFYPLSDSKSLKEEEACSVMGSVL